jgi:magnesium-transporting ATPase (P-type)
MSTADERVLVSKGAPDVLLGLCTRARVGMEVVALDEALRAKILADVDALTRRRAAHAGRGLRPLAAPRMQTMTPRQRTTWNNDLIFVARWASSTRRAKRRR